MDWPNQFEPHSILGHGNWPWRPGRSSRCVESSWDLFQEATGGVWVNAPQNEGEATPSVAHFAIVSFMIHSGFLEGSSKSRTRPPPLPQEYPLPPPAAMRQISVLSHPCSFLTQKLACLQALERSTPEILWSGLHTEEARRKTATARQRRQQSIQGSFHGCA